MGVRYKALMNRMLLQVMASLLLLLLKSQAQLIQHKSQRHEYHVVGMVPFSGAKFVRQYAPAFSHFLTQKVGSKFDPAIKFTIRFEDAYNIEPFDDPLANRRDFTFIYSSMAACLEEEFLQTLLTTVRTYRQGKVLNRYGAVIFALANRSDIQSVRDLKDKVIAATRFKCKVPPSTGVIAASNFKLCQQQWGVFEESGVSLMADTKQIRFTSKDDDAELQKEVLSGSADAAFTRTDSLESWEIYNPSTGAKVFKVVSAVTPAPLTDGEPFPFETSSELYPEYGLLAGAHVEWQIQGEVLKELLEVKNETVVCDAMYCNVNSSTGQYMNATEDDAQVQRILKMLNMRYADWIKSPDVLVKNCKVDGASGVPSDSGCCVNLVRCAEIASFQTALSNGPGRVLYQSLGLMKLDEKKRRWRCVRPSETWEGISCPAGMFKKSRKQVQAGCKEDGLSCPTDRYDICLCRPCKRAREVDIDFSNGLLANKPMQSDNASLQGCEKMTVCGSIRQNEQIVYTISDNRLRKEMKVTWSLREGVSVRTGVGAPSSSEFDFKYSFNLSSQVRGLHVLEIYLDGTHVPTSPVLLDVKSAICADEKKLPGLLDGVCRCNFAVLNFVVVNAFVEVPGGGCIHIGVLIAIVVLPVLSVMGMSAYLWKRHVDKMGDVIWEIDLNDLIFDDPPQELGRGTFGLVLAATYNTTRVAVKRVIPSKSDQFKRMNLFGSGTDSSQSLNPSRSNSSLHEEIVVSVPRDDFVFQRASSRNTTSAWNTMNTGLQTTMGVRTLSLGLRTLIQRIFPCVYTEYAIQRNNFIKEMRFLSKMRHPCITTVMGAVVASDVEPMLVMECMEYGSLHDLIHNYTMVLNGELVIPLLVDVCQGLSFLHSSTPPIIHGDLKAANVLVDSKFRAKVADFGALSGKKAVGACGTPFWMAPELLLGQLNSFKSDVYAFGIMVWEVYARQDPYLGEDPDHVLQQVADLHATPEKRPHISEDCPMQVQEIVKVCWNKDPVVRPAFSKLEHMLQRLDKSSMGPRGVNGGFQETQSRLLNDVFPKHIADKLRKGEKIEPDYRECVTIFFSDIVGFTEICSMIDASKVSRMLDRLYTAFDALLDEHRIFKVETIGDAYMAVTNLVEDQPNDHALRIAHFAIHAIEAANRISIDPQRADMGTINIRVGFHSGPVVANVVGTRNQRYCLFGDTVNTASRMEANSEAGRIHCSDQAAKILHKQMILAGSKYLNVSCRGEIPIKGKGNMKTHWVSRGPGMLPLPLPLLGRARNAERHLRAGSGLPTQEARGGGGGVVLGSVDEECAAARKEVALELPEQSWKKWGSFTQSHFPKRYSQIEFVRRVPSHNAASSPGWPAPAASKEMTEESQESGAGAGRLDPPS